LKPDSTDERQLIARLQRRDQQAMVALYDKYGRLVYSVIYRIVRDAAASEDLAQEAFFRIWNRIVTFDAERGALEAWVLTVARNRAIDYVRVKSVGRAADVLGIEALENPRLFTRAAAPVSAEDAGAVRAALTRLNASQRELIDLAYFEGLTQTELAERLSKPLGTIKSMVRSALKTLRQAMGQA
jgi:RNA polymerase sigma-70 factor (ECF subfamily)